MPPTPEKAEHDGPREPGCTCQDGSCAPHGVDDDGVCKSKSAFPGEPTYRCALSDEHPHKLHDDGEHHRWFEVIPELAVADWQADLLEAVSMLAENIQMPQHYWHEGTDRALRGQAEELAAVDVDPRLAEFQRRIDDEARKLAAVTQKRPVFIPYEDLGEATVEHLTAELRRLDHEIAAVRMRPVRFSMTLAYLRARREEVRQARAKLDAWCDTLVPRYPYPDPPTSAEAFAALQAPRLAQYFASPFRQVMEAAKKGADEMAKKKAENLGLPKVEYILCDDGGMRPLNSEAAKADHVMTRDGGRLFGIARWSKEPDEDAKIDWRDPTATSQASRAEAMAKLVQAAPNWQGPMPKNPFLADGEVRTTSSTGGEKGTKPARFDLIPVMPLTRLAEHYGVGAAKYADHNWRKGYELSKNYAALQRHVTAFWNGEDLDPETGTSHLSAVIFHAMAMQQNLQDFPQHDDRYKKEA